MTREAFASLVNMLKYALGAKVSGRYSSLLLNNPPPLRPTYIRLNSSPQPLRLLRQPSPPQKKTRTESTRCVITWKTTKAASSQYVQKGSCAAGSVTAKKMVMTPRTWAEEPTSQWSQLKTGRRGGGRRASEQRHERLNYRQN